MSFELRNAPATFQRLMDKVLYGLIWKSLVVYLDDVNIFAETFEQHLERLQITLNRFRESGLKLGSDKCYFCQTEAHFLGHVVNKQGVHPDPDKV